MEEMAGSIKDERRIDGVPEQPTGVLKIIDRLEDITEQMIPDKEKRSDGVPEQSAGDSPPCTDRLENIAEQMMPFEDKSSDGVHEQPVLQIIDRLEDFAEQMLQG